MMHKLDEAIHLITILYKSEDSISGFLDCLQRQSLVSWRLHVIDNASPDGSRALVEGRADPRIVIHPNAANLGFAKAANQGLRAAFREGAEASILVNNDIDFAEDFLEKLVAVARMQRADIVAPRVMNRDAPETAWYAGGRLEFGWLFRNIHEHGQPGVVDIARRVEFAPACCLLINRAVFEKVGLLDESFFVYWEDVDFCVRLKNMDIPILYVPEPFLLHEEAASSGGVASPSHINLYYRSYMQILRKHFGLYYTLRCIVRILLIESQQSLGNGDKRVAMSRAMLRGLVAPLRPEPRLALDVHR